MKIGQNKGGPPFYHLLYLPKKVPTLQQTVLYFGNKWNKRKTGVFQAFIFLNTSTKNNDLVLSERSRKKIQSFRIDEYVRKAKAR